MVPLSAALDVADDSGVLGDKITNDNSPLLKGVTEANYLVTLTINNQTYTTTANSNGEWEIKLNNFPDGAYNYSVVVTKPSGLKTTFSDTFHIDTVVPGSTEFLQINSDSGIVGDKITNIDTPTFFGKATEANVTVKLEIDGKSYETRSNTDGDWSIAIPDALSVGDKTYKVTVTDAAGNQSEISDTITIVSSDPLPAVTAQLTADSDSGVLQDSITKNRTPRLTGTAVADAIVTVTVAGKVYIVSADANGIWQVNIASPLADGVVGYTVRAMNAHGNASPVFSGQFTIDTDASLSDIRIADASDSGVKGDGITNVLQPIISGLSEVNEKIRLIIGGVVYQATANEQGQWSIQINQNLVSGENHYTVESTDDAGNVAVKSGIVTIDTQLPTLTGGVVGYSDPNVDITLKTGNPSFSGSTEPGSSVVIVINGTQYTATTDAVTGNWNFTPSVALTEGHYTYTIIATDKAGNIQDINGAFDIDLTPPSITGGLNPLTDPNNDGLINAARPVFSGNSELGSVVTINIDGNEYSVTTNTLTGAWRFESPVDLTEMRHTYKITATDSVGNIKEINGAFDIDLTRPDITGGLDGQADPNNTPLINTSRPVFSGSSEAGSVLVITIDGQAHSVTVEGSGLWRFQPTNALTEGNHTYTISATDLAGNTSTNNITGSFKVDSTAPDIIGGLDAQSDPNNDQLINTARPVFSGTSEAGSTVMLRIDTTEYNVTPSGGVGPWSFTPTSDLTAGPHSYSIIVTDAAGNKKTLTKAFDIDLTAPAITGGLNGQNDPNSTLLINLSKPLFSGTSEPGSAVTIRIDSTDYHVTAERVTGAWRFEPANALAQGAHTYSITATDRAGNTSNNNITGSFSIDSDDPDLTGGLDAQSDPNNDQLVNSATPVFSGTSEAGSTVTLRIDDTDHTVTPNGGTGAWRFQLPSALTEGHHSYTITATDAAGNKKTLNKGFDIDLTAPVITGGLNGQNDPNSAPLINLTRPLFSGTSEPGSTLTIRIDNTDHGVTADRVTGAWSFQPVNALTDGGHTYSITATDRAGNLSNNITGSFTIDSHAPDVTGGLNAQSDPNNDQLVNSATPLFSGTSEPGSTVRLQIGNMEHNATVNSTGAWSFTPTSALPEGHQTYTITATDAAGNKKTLSKAFDIDLTAPTITGGLNGQNDPNNTQLTNLSRPLFSGMSEKGAAMTIRIDNTDYHVTADRVTGAWSFQPVTALTLGGHTYSIAATDRAGNTSNNNITGSFTIDSLAPDVTGGLDAQSDPNKDHRVNSATPLFSGTSEPGSTVTLQIGNMEHNATVNSTGAWRFQLPSALTEGHHSYTITATDAAGNKKTLNNTVIVDLTPPNVSGGLDAGSDPNNDKLVNTTRPVFSGTSEPGSAVVLRIDNNEYNVTANSVTGAWSFTPTSDLTAGHHTYTITATDAAGNTRTVNDAFDIDRTAPTITGGLNGQNDPNNTVLTNLERPVFSGTTEAGLVVTLRIDQTDHTVTADSVTGAWSFTPTSDLTTGDHTYSISATDAAGNTGTVTGAFNVDRTPPAVDGGLDAGSDPNNDQLINTATPGFSGTSEAGAAVTLRIGNAEHNTTADSAGAWSVQTVTALPEGHHTYTITATDAAGNTSTVNRAFDIDRTAPNVNGGLDAGSDPDQDNIIDSTTPGFSGTSEAGSTLTINIDGTQYTVTTDPQTGDWNYHPTATYNEGKHNYAITATDRAGNANSINGTFTVDLPDTSPNPVVNPEPNPVIDINRMEDENNISYGMI
ncbi:hypothetical protein EHN07_05455 [Buttiauxella warmboldiae]|uniref:Bacterial Ig-like domain-containing protein n=1 Tax=Buttiauxella warmboldiae TaxID=82993 RepID=A0A3N5DM41_9ENTR|nr:Ig-like domain-containing protein [Buttiauxella warmboldiae]RPH29648.1 hypothetical protein EHN07_05455 [Buttiauxella warmboldiae]